MINKDELVELTDQLTALFQVMNTDTFLDGATDFAWNLFVKLRARGFTDDQAMLLVVGMAKTK